MIKEIFIMRSIACLCIVFIHAIGVGLTTTSQETGAFSAVIFDSINIILYFGTPMFIFISELLIAYSYKNRKIPDHFLSKRFKLIFLPFLFMAVFYSIPHATSLGDWGTKVFLNAVIGDFHGYFVLIIFQFYLLHLILHKHLKNWNPKVVLTVTLLINVTYLAVFNFTNPANIPFGAYIWERFYWVPFLGWIFYFALGFYCGHYYERFVSLIKEHRKWVLMAPVVTTALMLFLYHSEWLTVHSSKRIDLLLHTTAVSFFIFYVATQLKQLPNWLISISQYSFGIYLLHFFYILFIDLIYNQLSIQLGIFYIFILFAASTISSIGTIYYLNKWKYGQYIVGKIGIGYKNAEKEQNYKSNEHFSNKKGLRYSS